MFPWHLFVIQCTFIQLFYSCIYCLINNLCTHYIFSDLERAWVGCAIASAGIQIVAILTMICGLWPADCANAKRSTLYLVTSILCLIAGNHSYKNLQFVSHPRSIGECRRIRNFRECWIVSYIYSISSIKIYIYLIQILVWYYLK